mmetsp:Transcript_10617/g.20557  ORF Transcript_10617/g.20557 Transcript_10617/m.20557 type:complete len:364 (+) Transcript_10617:128-1219(+)
MWDHYAEVAKQPNCCRTWYTNQSKKDGACLPRKVSSSARIAGRPFLTTTIQTRNSANISRVDSTLGSPSMPCSRVLTCSCNSFCSFSFNALPNTATSSHSRAGALQESGSDPRVAPASAWSDGSSLMRAPASRLRDRPVKSWPSATPVGFGEPPRLPARPRDDLEADGELLQNPTDGRHRSTDAEPLLSAAGLLLDPSRLDGLNCCAALPCKDPAELLPRLPTSTLSVARPFLATIQAPEVGGTGCSDLVATAEGGNAGAWVVAAPFSRATSTQEPLVHPERRRRPAERRRRRAERLLFPRPPPDTVAPATRAFSTPPLSQLPNAGFTRCVVKKSGRHIERNSSLLWGYQSLVAQILMCSLPP